ncbi:MAG: TIGR03557 family F420-dependent LLM class oxidoreductase [Candidatus Hydrothermarchaeota archaeon]
MDLKLGYWAATEQYPPERLLEFAVLAERAGFESVLASDHFHPWFHTDAHASFTWVWMAAAAERTTRMEIGTGITAPILRYNPAIVAQAFGTLGALYPGRISIAVGTGEAMNEVPVGYHWPRFKERAARLEEAVKIIRLLWKEAFVSFQGKYFQLRDANLYTKPKKPIPIYIAASGPTVAEMAGRLGDGLLTIPHDERHYREVLFPAMERGAREAGRDPAGIEKVIELKFSYDEDYDRAARSIRPWASTAIPNVLNMPVYDPRELERKGTDVPKEELLKGWWVTTDPEEHIEKIGRFIRLGFNRVQLHSSSPDEEKFIAVYGKQVLPYLREEFKEP